MGQLGVELAAEMHDLVREDMPRFFPNIPVNDVSISIVHTRDAILNCFDRGIAAYATEHFAREGINLILNCRVRIGSGCPLTMSFSKCFLPMCTRA